MQKWWAEPVGVGAERQLFITAMWNVPPSQQKNLLGSCQDHLQCLPSCHEHLWGLLGWKAAGMTSFWGVRRKTWRVSEQSDRAGHECSYCLLQLLWLLWTYRWTPQECWNKPKSQLHCPLAYRTISGPSDWNTQVPRASPPSLLGQGSRVGDVHVKHIKAFEVFPSNPHCYSTESWAHLQPALLLHEEDGLHDLSRSF